MKPFAVNRSTRLRSPATVLRYRTAGTGEPTAGTAERAGLLVCPVGTSAKIRAVRTSRTIFDDGPIAEAAR